MKPQSNTHEVDLPAYKQVDGKICCECHKQHVISGDVVICNHQVVRHFQTKVEKVICRRCWNQERIKAKYGSSSPWNVKNYVTKV